MSWCQTHIEGDHWRGMGLSQGQRPPPPSPRAHLGLSGIGIDVSIARDPEARLVLHWRILTDCLNRDRDDHSNPVDSGRLTRSGQRPELSSVIRLFRARNRPRHDTTHEFRPVDESSMVVSWTLRCGARDCGNYSAYNNRINYLCGETSSDRRSLSDISHLLSSRYYH